MAYDAGTAFLQVVPSFAGVVTKIAAQATEWGQLAGANFTASFDSQVQDLKVGVDPVLNQTDVGQILSEMDVVTADRDLQVKPTIGAAASAAYLAEVTALFGLSAALGGGAAGGGKGGGLLAALGWQSGAFGIFAGFGSILSLMGLGFEHVAATVLGLAGSLGGALIGALALAGGALSIFAVGMVTDLGGIGQAAGDIKTVYTALSTYQTSSQGLAMQIPQTAAAQAALNTALAGFAPAAQQAVLAAALTASQFHWLYDQVTGVAESIGAQILNQAMQVGEKFLPILGQFAATNMGIIQSGLQPLFQFLGTTGVAVFTNLENIFTARLPTAMDAFDQGVELLVNTLNFLADSTTGGFMVWLDNFLTYLNTPAGFTKFEGFLTTTIGMFQKWWDLLKQLLITIYDIFEPSQGLGTSIVTTLTQMLKQLDKWITSTTGNAELKTIFTVHRKEVIELLKFLGNLLSVGGQMMLVVIPPFVILANALLSIANTILQTPILGTIVAWGAAATVLWKAMNLAAFYAAAIGAANVGIKLANMIPGVNLAQISTGAATFSGAVTEFSAAVSRFSGEAVGIGAEEGAGVMSLVLPLAGAAVIGAAIGLAIAPSILKFLNANSHPNSTTIPNPVTGLPVAADVGGGAPPGYQKTTNWASMWANMMNSAAANNVRNWFKNVFGGIATDAGNAGSSFATWFGQTVIQGLNKWAQGTLGPWFKSLPGNIWNWIQSIAGDFGKLWTNVLTGVGIWWLTKAEPWFAGLPGKILGALGDVGSLLLQVGKNIVIGLWNGMKDAWNAVTSWVGNLGPWIAAHKGPLSYDLVLLQPHGEALMQGLGRGLTGGFEQSVAPVLADITSKLGSISATPGVNLSGAGAAGGSVLAALQQLIALQKAAPALTGAAVGTGVDSKLGNVIQQHARTVVTLQRSGARA